MVSFSVQLEVILDFCHAAEHVNDFLCLLRALYRSEFSPWTAFWNPVIVTWVIVPYSLPTLMTPTPGRERGRGNWQQPHL